VGRVARAIAVAAVAGIAGLFAGVALRGEDEPAAVPTAVTVSRTVTAPAPLSPPLPHRLDGYHQPPLQQLVPARTAVVRSWTLAGGADNPSSVAVAWHGPLLEGSGWGVRGVSVWQRHRGGDEVWWSQDAALRTNAYEITGATADLTGDGRRELLLREEKGGTAGSGVYRLLAPFRGRARLLLVRSLSLDEGTIQLARGGVLVREGVGKDPRTAGAIHCCALKTRTTLLRWDGHRLAVAERTLKLNTGPPG
jgi:hypothetical protein